MTPRVFIGSSVEGLSVAYAIQENLEYRANSTVWPQGIFELSRPAAQSLVDTLDRMDFGIFVFTPDDTVTMRGQQNRVVRDNVVFELGLFVGRLGQERSFVVMPRVQNDLHLPSDLVGMTPATYDSESDEELVAVTGPMCTRIWRAMEALGPQPREDTASNPQETGDDSDESPTSQQVNTQIIIPESERAMRTEQWYTILATGHAHEAVEFAERTISAIDDEREQNLFRARMGRAQAREDVPTGVQYLEDLIDVRPESFYAYLQLALVYKDHNLEEDCLTTLNRGIEASRNNKPLRRIKAQQLAEAGEFESARELLEELIEEHPEYNKAYIALANILNDDGDIVGARRVYQSGLQRMPNDKELLLQYGSLLLEIEDHDTALTILTKLNALYPDHYRHAASLGLAYYKHKLYGLALEKLQMAREMAGGQNSWVMGNMGNLYLSRQFHPLAIETLEKALQLSPTSAYAHRRLSEAIQRDKAERDKAARLIRANSIVQEGEVDA